MVVSEINFSKLQVYFTYTYKLFPQIFVEIYFLNRETKDGIWVSVRLFGYSNVKYLLMYTQEIIL